MRAFCALVAGLCGIGMAATDAFVFNPSAASTACRTASSRRQQQQTRMVPAAAVTDSADSAVVAEDNDDELEDGEEWVEALWDGQRWPARTEDYNAMPADTRNWEVETERLPVWEDEPNPVEELTGKEWYEVFKPSDVEIDAAEFGFDWTEQWFEDNGMTRVDLPSEEDGQEINEKKK